MKDLLRTKRWVLFGMVMCVVSLGSAYAYPPTATVGVFAEQLIFPADGTAGYLTNLQLNGLFGWRRPLGSGSYLAFNADAELNSYLYSSPVFSDSEDLELEISFPVGSNRLDLDTGLGASLLGTIASPAFLRPDWQIKYRLERGRRKLRPYVAYEGYYLYQPNSNEDALYQGAEIGFVYRPSIRLGYQASLEGGWEGWNEYFLFDSGGNPTQDRRSDQLIRVNGEIEGLIGYFLSWKLGGHTGLRWSNANRYLEDLPLVEENSESNWFIYEEGSLSWSPHRQVDLQVGIFGHQELYLERDALTAGGALSGQALRVFSTGVSGRIDWTSNDRLYLVASSEAAFRLSNDPNEDRWNLAVAFGIDYSF